MNAEEYFDCARALARANGRLASAEAYRDAARSANEALRGALWNAADAFAELGADEYEAHFRALAGPRSDE